MVAGTMLLYPRYWDPEAQRFTTPEAAIETIAARRSGLARGPAPDRLIAGFWRRQQRKARVLARAWFENLWPRNGSEPSR